MNPPNKYKQELVPYFNCKGEDKGSLSAKHIYGKFLCYTEEQDYVGANLAVDLLKRGSDKHEKFNSFYEDARTNNNFLSLEDKFYNTW